MADRPPVKIGARLPEGTLNGLGAALDHLLDTEEADLYYIARARRIKREHNDETGVDWAIMRTVEIEPLVDGKMPTDYDHAGEALQALRGQRIGVAEIARADDADWARLAELRRQLQAYQEREGMSAGTIGERVMETIPGAAAGWRDDPRIIAEFLRTVDELDEQALEDAAQEQAAADSQATCEQCGQQMAVGLLAEHLATAHGVTFADIADAEVVDLTGEDDNGVPPATFSGPPD